MFFPPSVDPLKERVAAARTSLAQCKEEIRSFEEGVAVVHQIVFGKKTRFPISQSFPPPAPLDNTKIEQLDSSFSSDLSTLPSTASTTLFSPDSERRVASLSVSQITPTYHREIPSPPAYDGSVLIHLPRPSIFSPKTPSHHSMLSTPPKLNPPVQIHPPRHKKDEERPPSPPTLAPTTPKHVRIHIFKSRCEEEIETGAWAEALSSASGALALKPRNADDHALLLGWKGSAADKLGDPKLALASIKEGLSLLC